MSTLRSRVKINAPPERVWPFVADPVLESTWNPKMVAIDRDREGTVSLGERFQIEYVMSGRSSRCEAEVLVSDAPTRLVYRYHLLGENKPVSVLMTYDLRRTGDSTRLVQTVNMSGMGIPLPVRALIWFITRFGRSVGAEYLETLRAEVERLDTT